MNLKSLHSFSHKCYKNHLYFLSKFCEILIFLIYNSRVPGSAVIGKNTKFAYLGIGCVVHKDSIIGRGCVIGQSVTIGGRGPRKGVPEIGNNVYLGPGCRILGPIKIGDNVVVGANAVVIDDIPSGCIVVGIQAKIIKSGINDISKYL